MQHKLLIVSTHPIQYNAPLYKALAARNNISVKVFYTWEQSQKKVFDPGFGKEREWDIPLLEGYEYEFINNTSSRPGSDHFWGIINPSLIKRIEEYNPDTILITGWSFRSHLKVMRHFKGKKKIIFRGDSNLLDEKKGFSLKKTLRYIFLTWVYNYIDIALYVGSANKNYFLKYGIKESKLIFAPHAIDNNRFAMSAIANKSTVVQKREQLKISENAVVFVFAGKFETKKNPAILIEAFIKLNDTNTHLLLVGNGVIEGQLKEKVLAQEASIQRRIHFMPFQNQSAMPDIYCLGDVFCLVSQGPGETWGLAVNEAMACSKAVIVSDKCGCYMDLIKDGINGYVVRYNDEQQLINKMKTISTNNKKLLQMGLSSFEIIQEWSYEKVCTAIENAII